MDDNDEGADSSTPSGVSRRSYLALSALAVAPVLKTGAARTATTDSEDGYGNGQLGRGDYGDGQSGESDCGDTTVGSDTTVGYGEAGYGEHGYGGVRA